MFSIRIGYCAAYSHAPLRSRSVANLYPFEAKNLPFLDFIPNSFHPRGLRRDHVGSRPSHKWTTIAQDLTPRPKGRFDAAGFAGAFGDLGTLIPFVLAYISRY